MEAVLFIGLPASGKSTFFKERFFNTHVRISLDLLRTRHREQRLLEACLETEQPFVLDNTNPSRQDRAPFLQAAKARRFRAVAYYFQSRADDCLRRNAARTGRERVPEVAILASANRLERPTVDEGFRQLWYVRLEDQGFVVEEWRDDV